MKATLAAFLVSFFFLVCVGCDSEPMSGTTQVEFGPKDTSIPPPTWPDETSGLLWQVTPTGGYMDWSEAKAHCADLDFEGRKDWRLPTIGELRTLIRGCPATEDGGSCDVEEGDCLKWGCRDETCEGCGWWSSTALAGGCSWPDEMQGTCGWYWSSSPVEDIGDGAWGVDFGGGKVGSYYVDADFTVRCVRTWLAR